MQESILSRIFSFIRAGVSPYHAAAHACALLDAAGFCRLEEADLWTLAPGGRYYAVRGGSAVAAWHMPQGPVNGWRMAASHSDSPTWRIKNTAVAAGPYTKLEVEGYGGSNMASWLDRPLGVAGRTVVRTPRGLSTRLIDFDRDLCVIPSLAIHMDRALNDGHKVNPQLEMQPLWGPDGCRTLAALLAAESGVCPAADVVDFDLSLYTRQAPTRIGPAGEYFMAPRIDDLECAAATLFAFLDAEGRAVRPESECAGDGSENGAQNRGHSGHTEAEAGGNSISEGSQTPHAGQNGGANTSVWLMLDNEEVGSGTRQGAQSTFVRDLLDRILAASTGCGAQSSARALANSFVLSADNAHANHPNFPEKADPANPVRLNGGVVLKVNASQKYTTNGLSGGIFREICRRADVPVQLFANRADLPGGSTLGNLQSHTVPVLMADIGLAQLAMHSAVETTGCADAETMVRAVTEFYRTSLRAVRDDAYELV
jgi:aspartyl aminopeptidase